MKNTVCQGSPKNEISKDLQTGSKTQISKTRSQGSIKAIRQVLASTDLSTEGHRVTCRGGGSLAPGSWRKPEQVKQMQQWQRRTSRARPVRRQAGTQPWLGTCAGLGARRGSASTAFSRNQHLCRRPASRGDAQEALLRGARPPPLSSAPQEGLLGGWGRPTA